MLALYRLWNIVEYWFPYRDLLEGNWDDELTAFIPRVALANDSDAYKRELIAFIARIHDTHANLWSSLDARPPVGACRIPVTMRFVENQAVVTGYAHAEAGPATGLQVGDVVEAIDGVAVGKLVERWTTVLCRVERADAPARHRAIDDAGSVRPGNGAGPEAGRRGGVEAGARAGIDAGRDGRAHARQARRDVPQAVRGRRLSQALVRSRSRRRRSTSNPRRAPKGLVIDIRNYPSEFVVFALGSRLVDRPTPFARFTIGDPSNPGAFYWRGGPVSLDPGQLRATPEKS